MDANGQIVPDATISLSATVTGPAFLAGFGTGNPVTAEDYTNGDTVTFRGRAMAILRSGYEAGPVTLRVTAPGLPDASVTIR